MFPKRVEKDIVNVGEHDGFEAERGKDHQVHGLDERGRVGEASCGRNRHGETTREAEKRYDYEREKLERDFQDFSMVA